MYGETRKIFGREFFCLPDMAPIREIYCSQIFSDLGYLIIIMDSINSIYTLYYVVCASMV